MAVGVIFGKRTSPRRRRTGIAVLPFENLSTTERTLIRRRCAGRSLNELANIAALKVISRTSVMQYRAERIRTK